jgi:hypothetical protein
MGMKAVNRVMYFLDTESFARLNRGGQDQIDCCGRAGDCRILAEPVLALFTKSYVPNHGIQLQSGVGSSTHM